MTWDSRLLALDVRDRIRAQVSQFNSRVHTAGDESATPQNNKAPFSWIYVESDDLIAHATGEDEIRVALRILVASSKADVSEATTGSGGALALAKLVRSALKGHEFDPSSGDNSGPWCFVPGMAHAPIEMRRQGTIGGIPIDLLGIEAWTVAVEYIGYATA